MQNLSTSRSTKHQVVCCANRWCFGTSKNADRTMPGCLVCQETFPLVARHVVSWSYQRLEVEWCLEKRLGILFFFQCQFKDISPWKTNMEPYSLLKRKIPGDSIRDLGTSPSWMSPTTLEFGSREFTIPERSRSQNCEFWGFQVSFRGSFPEFS